MARIPKIFQQLGRLSAAKAASEMGVPPPMQLAVFEIPGGDKGTRETLERMRNIVWRTIKDKKWGPFFRQLSIRITLDAGCKTKDFKCEAKSLFEYVRDKVKWIRDVKGFETLQYPHRTLEFGGGDCDDLSILLATLAVAIGIPAAFKAIAANPTRKSQFSHVYVLLDPFGNGKWVPADPTVKSASFGWESPVQYKEMIIEV